MTKSGVRVDVALVDLHHARLLEDGLAGNQRDLDAVLARLDLEGEPAGGVGRRRWRSPESTLTTSTWRPTIELVPSGPRTVPLMVPSVDCEASPGFRIGVPRRHEVTLMNATVNAATQSSAISGAR